MITSQQTSELVAEFGELTSSNVVLAKEVYAHFGLLFFKFSLIEYSLIHALTQHHLGTELAAKRIRSKDDWEKAFDKGHENATRKTFGNLVRELSSIAEFKSIVVSLKKITKSRNYFAHHFFREEVGMYSNDEGCWHILWAIKELRDQIISLDKQLGVPTTQMCERLGIPAPSEEAVQRAESELLEKDHARIESNDPFDWN